MIGQRVNNYEIVSLLGEGGMGSVYLATHPFMGRKAAVKVLRRELVEDRSLVERFMNEARAANAIHHPNIIDIIDVGLLATGVPYLMMEFLEGDTLARRIQDSGTLAPAEAIDIAVQTASALGAAHRKGIVHRDLKPENLFLVPDETRPHGAQVKVLDFGIAKLRGELAGNSARTQDGALMGTPPYMSPEQCRGLIGEIDDRTDVYALGIIVYQMLVGAPPFVSPGFGEVVLMHLTQAPKPPRATRPEVPAALEAAVLKALAKKREDRFTTMGDLEAALRVAGNLTPVAPSPRAAAALPQVPATSPGTPAATTSTTFKSAAGEVDPEATGARRGSRRLVTMGGLAALAAIAIAAFSLLRPREPSVPATTPAAAAPAAATPAPVAPVAAAPAAPAPPLAEVPPSAPAAPPVEAQGEPPAQASATRRHKSARAPRPAAPARESASAPARPAEAPPPVAAPAAKVKPPAEKW